MKPSSDWFTRAARRGTVVGAAALIAGVALAPAASADESTGTPADTLLRALSSASATGSGSDTQDGAQQPQGPRVAVSQSVISANGEHQITVSGSGFKDDSVVATRPPLTGKNPGVYVVLGKFADAWKPSEGAASDTRKSISQYWAVNAEDVETIGGADRGAIVMDADGSFTATLTVSKALVDEVPGDGNLGIYTYAGGGAKHAAWETSQPISFVEPGLFGSLTGLLPVL